MRRIYLLLIVVVFFLGGPTLYYQVLKSNLHQKIEVDLDTFEIIDSSGLLAMSVCYNLRTVFLTGEDAGGSWTVISAPVGSTLTSTILESLGDNPCIDFDVYGCGNYTLRYSVEDDLCVSCFAETDISFYKCCITGSATCS